MLPLLALGLVPTAAGALAPFDASDLLAGLSASASASMANASRPHSLAAGTSFIELEFGGRTRDAILYVPETPAGAALPLVFNYHGFGSDALQVLYADMGPLADAEGFAVIYPYGVGIAGVGRSFNGGACCRGQW